MSREGLDFVGGLVEAVLLVGCRAWARWKFEVEVEVVVWVVL